MSNADFWAKKLGNPQPVAPRQADMPMPPSQMPMTPYVAPQNPMVSKAQSAAQSASCPNCASNNFMSVNNATPRCFDCGYPTEQSGSKYGTLQGAKVEGSAKQSIGNNTQSNWNPQAIIGRIGE